MSSSLKILMSLTISSSVGFFLTEPRAAAGVREIPKISDSVRLLKSTKSFSNIPFSPCLAPITSSNFSEEAFINPTKDLFITAVGPPDCPIIAFSFVINYLTLCTLINGYEISILL